MNSARINRLYFKLGFACKQVIIDYNQKDKICCINSSDIPYFVSECCSRLKIVEKHGNQKTSKVVNIKDDLLNGKPVWQGDKAIFYDGTKWNIGHSDMSVVDYMSTANFAKCPEYVGNNWSKITQAQSGSIYDTWQIYDVSCAFIF